MLYREIIDKNRQDLDTQLREMLGGVQRVPALLFGRPHQPLEEVNLERYEVCPCEPLHDVKGHIKNILTELPKHLHPGEPKEFVKAREIVFEDKQQYRGYEYRKAILIIANYLDGKVREKVQFLFNSLAEISRLLYLPAKKRTQKIVLRIHNITFLHSLAIKEVIPEPKAITPRVLYGIYHHSIVCHAPQVTRVKAPSSTNTEKQERAFSAINGICNATSSGRPGEIVDNVLVRLQAEDNTHTKCLKTQQSAISKFARVVPELGNSIIPKHTIAKQKNEYQAHLERVADFLLCGPGVWWRENPGVEFFDGLSEPEQHSEGPPLHHFRSSNLKMEEYYLHECWSQLTSATSTIKIPHPHIKLYDSDGNRSGEIKNQMWTEPGTNIPSEMDSTDPINNDDSHSASTSHTNDDPIQPHLDVEQCTQQDTFHMEKVINLEPVNDLIVASDSEENAEGMLIFDCKIISTAVVSNLQVSLKRPQQKYSPKYPEFFSDVLKWKHQLLKSP